MGNLNRAPRHILVNTVDQTIFGAYKDENGIPYLVHKPLGLYIPGRISNTVDPCNIDVQFGSTVDNVKEVALLRLDAPYPADPHNYSFILNMTRIGRRQGGIDSHRRESKSYDSTILNLVAGTTQIADDDKLIAAKEIVTLVNNDPHRFVNAGMTWVIKNEDFDDASSILIRLQDGTEYTIAIAGTTGATSTSLAYAINNTTTLKDYVKAYGATVASANDQYTIIENIVPCYFEVEEITTGDVSIVEWYLRCEVQEEDYMVEFGSGTASNVWVKVPHVRWNIDTVAGTCVDGADDADATVTSGSYTAALNVSVNTNNATKCLNLAQLLGTALSTFPTNVYSAALNTATTVSSIIIGVEATIAPTAGTDKIVCTETEVKHKWSSLDTAELYDLFPIRPEEAYMTIERPIRNQDYCKLSISWDMTNHPDVTIMDGYITKKGEVIFYILKSELPAIYAYGGTDLDFWKAENAGYGTTNYMSDDIPASPTVHFWELLTAWYAASLTSLITPSL
jgi:hypothetical protein